MPVSKSLALSEAKKLLDEWLTPPKPIIRVHDPRARADLVAEHDDLLFVINYKAASSASVVRDAIEQAKKSANHLGKKAIPIVAVPYMGDVGKELCASAGISWFDLSGNARIVAHKLRIIVEGRPNKFA